MTLYLASSNAGKLRELRTLAEADDVRLEALSGYDRLPRAPEEDASFALNAMEKALYYSRLDEGLIVADDSGLVVDSLGGRPGPHSARYAGARASDEDNNRKLLAELAGLPEGSRTARYLCVLVLAHQNLPLALFSDSCEGLILDSPRGSGGFGYDPLFLFPPLGRTMAELDVAEKNRHSHRGKAFRALLAYLREHKL